LKAPWESGRLSPRVGGVAGSAPRRSREAGWIGPGEWNANVSPAPDPLPGESRSGPPAEADARFRAAWVADRRVGTGSRFPAGPGA